MKMRKLAVPVPFVLALSVLGCGGEGPDATGEAGDAPGTGQEADFEYMGTGEGCDREPRQPLTRPIHTITVRGGEVTVDPHPMVQPPGPAGIIGWRSRTHHWQVTYTNGSPLPNTTYSGRPGELVYDFVQRDAACRAYDYEVKVWRDAEAEQAPVDTTNRSYPAALADTVNGDEIEPYRFRR